jgi:hypothetical protein
MPRIRWGERCTAHRSDGTPCGAWAIRGGYVCRMHGGAAPQVRSAAHMRLFEERKARFQARWNRSTPAYRDSITRAMLGLRSPEDWY